MNTKILEHQDDTIMFASLPEEEHQKISSQQYVKLSIVANFVKWLSSDNRIEEIIHDIKSSIQTEIQDGEIVLRAGLFVTIALQNIQVSIFKLDSLIKSYNEENPQMQLPVIFIEQED